jgi:hypothetical protein
MSVKDKHLKAISEIVGININYLYQVVGEELPTNQTDEIKKKYLKSTPGSEEKKSALKEWIETCKSPKEFKDLLETCLSHEHIYLKDRDPIIKRWIESCITFDEINDVFCETENNTTNRDLVIKKRAQIYNEEIEDAISTYEIIKIFNNLCLDSKETKTLGLKKWIELSKKEIENATTLTHIKKAYDNIPYNNKTEYSELEKETKLAINKTEILGLKKWIEILIKQIENATTIIDIKKVYGFTPNNDETKKMVLIKWNSISIADAKKATTINKIRDIWCEATWNHCHKNNIKDLELINLFNTDNHIAKESVLKKWNEISIADAKKATTFYKIVEVWNNSPNHGDARDFILPALIAFSKKEIENATTFFELEDIYTSLPADKEIQHLAINKMVELYLEPKTHLNSSTILILKKGT